MGPFSIIFYFREKVNQLQCVILVSGFVKNRKPMWSLKVRSYQYNILTILIRPTGPQHIREIVLVRTFPAVGLSSVLVIYYQGQF